MRLFTPNVEEICDFIRVNAFSTIVSKNCCEFISTPLPLIFGKAYDGKHGSFIGHFARSNPHVEIIRNLPEAVAIFQGPHAYISPSWLRDRTQAPTWNFMHCEAQIKISFDEGEQASKNAVERLTSKMESGRLNHWSPFETGARYERLIQHIIPFSAEILSLKGKFKLGQNERKDVFDDIVLGLKDGGKEEMATAMVRWRPSERTS